MQLCEFIQKLESWPDMDFTAIENVKRQDDNEIYAIDSTSQTLSRLLIFRTPDALQAAEMTAAFNAWLEKANRGKRKRRNEKSVSSLIAYIKTTPATQPSLPA